jgi:indole-3-glycerol phosphate synthase/phosphoribosylanthranilate isomerase
MANVLEKIVADKRIEIAQKKLDMPLDSFKSDLQPNTNSFFEALAADGTSYIFECKKASPSKGLIRDNFDLDEITQAYSKEAAGFSVLTDIKYFQGQFDYLPYVVNKVSQPCLNKDFFVEAYQVYLARHLGASAVLLMLSVLSDEEYAELSDLTHSLNMDVLTEVSNHEETERALALGAKIIGINNRNLRDLSTDLSTTEALAPVIRKDKRFNGVIISESGIYTHGDIQRLSPLVDGFLVGSALMAQDNLDLAISQLVYGKVKVCGITSIEQIDLLKPFPISYLGLIFAPQSKRFVSVESALEIVNHARTNTGADAIKSRLASSNFIGVFVNQAAEVVAEYVHKLELAGVQLHGNEDKQYIEALKQVVPGKCKIIKVVSVQGDAIDASQAKQNMLSEITSYQSLLDSETLSHILLDCKIGKEIGGTGQSFDWRWLDDIKDKHRIILAGGISSQNAKAASDKQTDIIDVNSGVEEAPGQKSAEMLSALFTQLRA